MIAGYAVGGYIFLQSHAGQSNRTGSLEGLELAMVSPGIGQLVQRERRLVSTH